MRKFIRKSYRPRRSYRPKFNSYRRPSFKKRSFQKRKAKARKISRNFRNSKGSDVKHLRLKIEGVDTITNGQSVEVDIWTLGFLQSTLAAYDTALSTTLSQNISMYQYYKINCVVRKYYMQNVLTYNDDNKTSMGDPPVMSWFPYYDGDTSTRFPSTGPGFIQAHNYPAAKEMSLINSKPIVMKVYPKIGKVVNIFGVTTSSGTEVTAPTKAPWLLTVPSVDVNHYGRVCAFRTDPNGYGPSNFPIQLSYTDSYYLSFKKQRI
nr:MAG: capsid protein [Cressdnaviricota sp.]